jgi:hypothetical protein
MRVTMGSASSGGRIASGRGNSRAKRVVKSSCEASRGLASPPPVMGLATTITITTRSISRVT